MSSSSTPSLTPAQKNMYQDHVKSRLQNFSTVLEKLQIDSLLIHSGSPRMRFLDDQDYLFRPNPLFSYWLPLNENPHCFLWIEKDKKPTLFYYRKIDFWHKMPEDPHGFWTDSFNIVMITDVEEVAKHIGQSKLSQAVYVGEWPEKFTQWKLKDNNPENLLNELHYMRTKKTAYEFFCMREASRKGAYGHAMAKKAFEQGLSEFEIDIEYIKAINVHEFDRPYNHIVALNENAGVLHYNFGERQRPEKDKIYSFLLDAGCSYLGYASDITRTYSFNPQDEFGELVKAFNEMQLKIIKELKLGVLYTDNHINSHREVGKILKDFDFIRMSPEEMVEKKVTHAFYPHGLGHFLGLQVHDVGGYFKDAQGHKNKPPVDHPYLRCTSEIKPGHVFTIEPGLYFIPSLLKTLRESDNGQFVNWEKVERFAKYGGIRIEDNICVHEDRFENVTRDAFALYQ